VEDHVQLSLIASGQEMLTKDDYYTPKEVFDRLALRFDLDVCAPPGGVPWIPADKFYTLEDDGLSKQWEGRVWMNPPYSKATEWVRRFIAHRHGIALVGHAKSAWHPELWATADACAMPFRYFDFIGGSIFMPVWFAAFGEECVEAISRVGVVRYRADYRPVLHLPEPESGGDEVAVWGCNSNPPPNGSQVRHIDGSIAGADGSGSAHTD
jgi:hypothetical protein